MFFGKKMIQRLLSFACILATIHVAGCKVSFFASSGGGDGLILVFTSIPNASIEGCFLEDYSNPVSSRYILPYQIGMSYSILQGNCGAFNHQPMCVSGFFPCGDARYAYDHNTPIGMIVIASRGGTIISVVDTFPNGTQDATQVNFISIQHDDGTVGRYLHLNPNSAMVVVGQVVLQGDLIALTGNSGDTGGTRHLHFDVVANQGPTCLINVDLSSCRTLPVTFRNSNPLDSPLIEGNTLYEALVF